MQRNKTHFSWYKSTKFKITIARFLYIVIILVLRKPKRIIQRNKIKYAVDLTEGIDFSLFLFGNFQKHITNNVRLNLPLDGVIFDVGANLGDMTLQFAKAVPKGHVYAFEPTHYAYAKLLKNLSINPEISKNISPLKLFLSDKSIKIPKYTAFSSWKIDGSMKKETTHPIHLGNVRSAAGVSSISIDKFCKTHQINRIDLIKIDTDGYDYKVLQGAIKSIFTFRPAVIFEIGDYLLKEHNIEFSFYFEYFTKINYTLYESQSGKELRLDNSKSIIPQFGTIDILALFNG